MNPFTIVPLAALVLALGAVALIEVTKPEPLGHEPAFSAEVKRTVTPGEAPEPFRFQNFRGGEPAIGDEFVLRVGKKEGCGETDDHCKILMYLHKK